MAEYFRDRGQHALIVIDDLTKHAATHRELALLTRQPPGREAYPGDVFHVHARLLERAAKLSPEKGGGSLTALPIAETDAGNLSAYIPTNLISITDGQIVLDAKLFHEERKPAVDVGLSVSRVGGKTQAPALREAAESLRLDYAQFLELEIFTRFGGMSDVRVKQQIIRGERIRAALNQPQYAPLSLAEEVGPDPGAAERVARSRGRRGCAANSVANSSRRLAAGRTRRDGGDRRDGTLDDANRAQMLAALKASPPNSRRWRSRCDGRALADISAHIENVRQLERGRHGHARHRREPRPAEPRACWPASNPMRRSWPAPSAKACCWRRATGSAPPRPPTRAAGR